MNIYPGPILAKVLFWTINKPHAGTVLRERPPAHLGREAAARVAYDDHDSSVEHPRRRLSVGVGAHTRIVDALSSRPG